MKKENKMNFEQTNTQKGKEEETKIEVEKQSFYFINKKAKY